MEVVSRLLKDKEKMVKYTVLSEENSTYILEGLEAYFVGVVDRFLN